MLRALKAAYHALSEKDKVMSFRIQPPNVKDLDVRQLASLLTPGLLSRGVSCGTDTASERAGQRWLRWFDMVRPANEDQLLD